VAGVDLLVSSVLQEGLGALRTVLSVLENYAETVPPDLTVAQLAAQWQSQVGELQAALQFVEKFSTLLPTQYQSALAQLEQLLSAAAALLALVSGV